MGWAPFVCLAAAVALGIPAPSWALLSREGDRGVRGEIEAGRYAIAESLAWAVLGSVEHSDPVDSQKVATALDEVAYAMLLNGRGRDPRARAMAHRSVEILERMLPRAAPRLGRSLLTLGRIDLDCDRYQDAITLFELARRTGGLALPGEEPDTIRALFDLGTALLYRNETGRGWAVLDTAHALRLRTLGPRHPALLSSILASANRLWMSGKLDSAIVVSDRGLALASELWGPIHPGVTGLLRRKAACLRFSDRATEAQKVYDETIRVQEHTLRPDHPDLARTYIQSAVNLIRLSEIDRSRLYFERAVPIVGRELGFKSVDYARALAAEAELCSHVGDVARARALLEQSLAIYEDLGTSGIARASTMRVLGGILLWNGWPEDARRYIEASHALYEENYPPNHPEVAIAKLQVASALHMAGELDKAATYARDALAIFREAHGPYSSTVGDCLKRLGEIAMSGGRYSESVQYLEEAHRVLTHKGTGESRFWAANSLIQLGSVHHLAGRLEEAQRYREEALRSIESVYGEGHPQTIPLLHALALVLEERGERAEAFQVALQAMDRTVPLLRRSLWQLPEKEALTYSRDVPLLMGTISALARDGGPAVSNGPRRAMDALIRSRGLVLEETTRRLQHLRQANDPRLKQLQSDFAEVSRRLAALELGTGAGAAKDATTRAKLLRETGRERDAIERELGAKDPAFSIFTGRAHVGIEDVARSLPPRSALISFVFVDRRSFLDGRDGVRQKKGSDGAAIPPTPSRPPTYAAFVLVAGDSSPALVPLGSADRVERAVEDWLREAGVPPPRFGRERTAAELRCVATGERLRRCVWDPIRPLIGGVDRVFIVPDGALNAVSFHALPFEGTYLAEGAVLLHYLSAERDLVLSSDLAVRGSGLIAMGGADFDAVPRQAPWIDDRGDTSGTPVVYRGPHAPCPEFRDMDFAFITGSLREVEEITAMWRGAAPSRGEALQLQGPAASEEAVKRHAPGRRVVHLATHGFLLSDECGPARIGDRGVGIVAPSVQASKESSVSVTPRSVPSLLLSGLALAGANRRDSVTANEEDGVLTAEEIAAMDLSGVEWVVISACESGRGPIRVGEGVLGLRRAFHLAGASTTVMSLWSVEDQATRDWMRALYEARLVRDRTTAESVRDATRAVLASRRASSRTTHPFFWGGFVAEGDWR